MDPNSSTFCLNYLSKFPNIKPETINTLCFNGFTNYHQLIRLEASDLPFIRDIDVDQKAAVRHALNRFADHTNGGANGAGGGLDVVSIASNSTDSGVSSGSSNAASTDGLTFGNSTAAAASASARQHVGAGLSTNNGGGGGGIITTAGSSSSSNNNNSATNSFYSISNESSIQVTSATAAFDDSGNNIIISSNSTGTDQCAEHFGNSVSSQIITVTAVATAQAVAEANDGTECGSTAAAAAAASRPSPSSSSTSAITGSDSSVATRSSEVIAAQGSNSPSSSSSLILLAGNNASSSTSSIYQRIDQFDLTGSSGGGGDGGGTTTTDINDHDDDGHGAGGDVGSSGSHDRHGSLKLGETVSGSVDSGGNNNLSSTQQQVSGSSLSKRRKQNETVTAAVNSATLSSSTPPPPSSSSSSSPSSSSSQQSQPQPSTSCGSTTSALLYSTPDLDTKSLTGDAVDDTTGSHQQPPPPTTTTETKQYKRPKRLLRVFSSPPPPPPQPQPTAPVPLSEDTSSHLAIAPVCTVQISGEQQSSSSSNPDHDQLIIPPCTTTDQQEVCESGSSIVPLEPVVVTDTTTYDQNENIPAAIPPPPPSLSSSSPPTTTSITSSSTSSSSVVDPVNQTVSRMPYAILEQLDCTKKLENGQKPTLLYHFGGGAGDGNGGDNKKEGVESVVATATSIGGDQINYLVTGKINNNSGDSSDSGQQQQQQSQQFEALTSSNINLIIDPASQLGAYHTTTTAGSNTTETNSQKSPQSSSVHVVTATSDNNTSGGGASSQVASPPTAGQAIAIATSPSGTSVDNQSQQQQQQQQQLHLMHGGNVVQVSSVVSDHQQNSSATPTAFLHTGSALQSSTTTLATLSQSPAVVDAASMQIRDYLSEINVVPVSSINGGGGLVSDGSPVDVNSAQHTTTVLANSSMTNFLTSTEHHQQLMKATANGGSIIIDQSHSLDPTTLNNYVYSTLQLQLAPTPTGATQVQLNDSNKSPILDSSKSQQQQQTFFTLGAANLQPATLSPTQQVPIGQQVLNAVAAAQQQQQQHQQHHQPPLSPQSNSSSSRRGRGRPKKYSDPLSLAVEQCLENSNSPTQPSSLSGITHFTTSSGSVASSPGGTPTIHYCRWAGCGFSSNDILEFRNHNRSLHRDESTIIPSRKGKTAAPKEPLVCEVPGCGYSPKYRRLLIDHQNAHKGLRAHKCCFCEYNSSYFGDIRKHMIKKHPDLAQEIKMSKMKLKQNGLDGKSPTKKELDELGLKLGPDGTPIPKSIKTKEPRKRSSSSRKSRSKKAKQAEEQAAAAAAAAAFAGNEANKQQQQQQQLQQQQLSISNLTLAGQQAANQYGFMTATPAGPYGHIQSAELMTANNYGTLMAAPAQTIIYLQTPTGQTVQLAANDMTTLNQLISGYDLNSLNGQIAMATTGHHPQVQSFATAPQQQQQQQHQSQQQQVATNGQLTSICLDGSNGTSGTTLAFVTDPSQHQQQQQQQATTTTIYKCDSPLCYYQTDQYESILLHKHRDHTAGQNASGQQQQQQQITIIDASQLAQAVGSSAVSQHLTTSSQHQFTTVNAASTNVVSSSVYLQGLESYGITTTANIANQLVATSGTVSESTASFLQQQPQATTILS